MKAILQQHGYVFNIISNLWAKPEYGSIAYSDGDDTEQRLARIIESASDLTVLSAELREHCTDWPSRYHLSSSRANILRPFQQMLAGDILEIGCGCGAITRYLGETGGNVLALEGSIRRASIARSRTRDLKNVTVLAESFNSFEFEGLFDVVTLVGVLEYANLFTPGNNAALTMLQRARALLKPEGKLIIAIENQLGLKYFAGAPEDHIGAAMYGVEDRYTDSQPRTYGRKALTDLLEGAGFKATEFLAPFPDYKLPASIVTGHGMKCRDFDASAFAWQSVRRDPQLPEYCNFSLELAWPQLFENDLALETANSFLVVASRQDTGLVDKNILAYHYSTDRFPQYCKETLFVLNEAKSVEVKYRKLGTRHGHGDVAERIVEFDCPASAEYSHGRPLSLRFIKLITRDNWTYAEIGSFLKHYISILTTISKHPQLGTSLDPTISLPGQYLDIVPQNIIISANEEATVIDTEWTLFEPIELGHLLFRSLVWMMGSVTRFGKPHAQSLPSKNDFIQLSLREIGYILDTSDILRYTSLEAQIQKQVTGSAFDSFLTDWLAQSLQTQNLIEIAEIRREEILERHHAQMSNQDHIARLNLVIEQNNAKIVDQEAAIEARNASISRISSALANSEREVSSIKESRSWKMTKPLRHFGVALRKALGRPVGSIHHNSDAKKGIYDSDYAPTQYSAIPEFNPDFYLIMNPDVATSGVDPLQHYLSYGKAEGRVGKLPQLSTLGDLETLDCTKETVLIVGHDGSRSGAPILTYNLVTELIQRYNVVVLFLGPGPILKDCHKAGAVVISVTPPISLTTSSTICDLLIKPITDAVPFKFAVVNSVQSRVVLATLAQNYIPTLTLIHEFPAYIYPKGGVRDVAFWSGETIFSTKLTRENSYSSEIPDLIGRNFPILPQGRCSLPPHDINALQPQADISRLVRPQNFPAEGVVVLGVGLVELRKGVDIFLSCAAAVCEAARGLPIRFVWIGKGYAPETNDMYSMFLADQILRAGLQNNVFFIGELSDLEAAYRHSDLLVISSRLDPLPNTAIDALTEGLPVVCFDKATGIAEILQDYGLGRTCVAQYMNTQDLAQKVLSLVQSPALRTQTSLEVNALGRKVFDMATYVRRLEKVADQVCARTEQERADADLICESILFQPDYSLPLLLQTKQMDRRSAARTYVRGWASLTDPRKPAPGFHPGIYLEMHGTSEQNADPFADYIKSGRPEGPWNLDLILPQDAVMPIGSHIRIGLHIHVYYPELLPEIIDRLKVNQLRPDLLISVTNDEARQIVIEQLSFYKDGSVDVRIVPNRGRDIGPFLTEFAEKITNEYDVIGHIHTKKTIHNKPIGKHWYKFILENLLGSQVPMADIIVGKIAEDSSIGMVFPDDPNALGWSKNRPYGDELARQMGIGALPKHFVFPMGTMFWANASALKKIFDLKMQWTDYPDEPLPIDGTILHAIERLFPFIVEASGKKIQLTYVPGLTR